jgi:hypothetical protein
MSANGQDAINSTTTSALQEGVSENEQDDDVRACLPWHLFNRECLK